MDEDFGDTAYYSGSGPISNTDPINPQITRGVKALRHSMSIGRPLRIIRSGDGKGEFRPACGYRYDGLYILDSEELRRNKLGGAYIRFKLLRMHNEKDIDTSRPNHLERLAFNQLKDMV